MYNDFFDLNDAEPQRGELIPPGVYPLHATVKPGYVVDNHLRPARNGYTKHLELELSVVGGEHGGKKVWDYITLAFDADAHHDDIPPVSSEQAEKYRTAVRMGRSRLKAIIDSAYGLDPNDKSDEAKEKRLAISQDYLRVSGLTYWAQVEVEQDNKGKDRNKVDFIITPDLPDYPHEQKQQEPVWAPKALDDGIPF